MRLSAFHQDKLREFARRSLVCEPQATAEAAATEEAMAVLRRVINHLAPESDMVVLRRHQATHQIEYLDVRVADEKGDYRWATRLPAGQRDLARRSGHVLTTMEAPRWFGHVGRSGTTIRASLLDTQLPPTLLREVVQASQKWTDAVKDHNAARDVVLDAIDLLINTTATFNALVAVWPAAEALRDQVKKDPARTVPPESQAVIRNATFQGGGE